MPIVPLAIEKGSDMVNSVPVFSLDLKWHYQHGKVENIQRSQLCKMSEIVSGIAKQTHPHEHSHTTQPHRPSLARSPVAGANFKHIEIAWLQSNPEYHGGDASNPHPDRLETAHAIRQ
jgi:hypothetical protein